MNLSLGEFQATAAKALRGAGYSWGMSAEGANVCRSLAAMGIDPSRNLLRLLAVVDDLGIAGLRPDHAWATTSGRICPLSIGAALSDEPPTTTLTFEGVVEPILLIPSLATLASDERGFDMRWEGGSLQIGVDGPEVWAVPPAADVIIEAGPAPEHSPDRATRIDVPNDTLELLNAFAHRTYAPATEASRQAGAGAGTNDND
jgi:hypothetical protein